MIGGAEARTELLPFLDNVLSAKEGLFFIAS